MDEVGKCIARTKNIEEARAISEQYKMQGYKTQIFDKSAAGILLFEVWIFKEKQGLQ